MGLILVRLHYRVQVQLMIVYNQVYGYQLILLLHQTSHQDSLKLNFHCDHLVKGGREVLMLCGTNRFPGWSIQFHWMLPFAILADCLNVELEKEEQRRHSQDVGFVTGKML